MKKRITPFYLVFSVAMLIMALVTLYWSFPAFCAEAVISLITSFIVLISHRKYNKYITEVLSGALEAMSGKDREFLSQFPVAAAILGNGDKIIWYNGDFAALAGGKKNLLEKPLGSVVSTPGIDALISNKYTEVSIGEKYFTTVAVRAHKSTILYFFDNTEYIKIKEKYKETRPAVAIVYFDNRYELERDYDEDQLSATVASVEAALQKWAGAYNAMFVKSSRNMYMITFEEKDIAELTDLKFPVLDDIRAVKYGENRRATVSIGIGRGGDSFRICQSWAKKALDICKGRGGDQVAVYNGKDYKFFGGKSMGVETYDKVRTRVIASALAEKVRTSEKVIIMGHKFSDLDCIGSAVGLWSVITKGLNKHAYIAVNKELSNAQSLINKFEKIGPEGMFISPEEALQLVTDKTLLIVVDTHSPKFIESTELYKACKSIVVIDHHRIAVEHIDNADIFFHEPFASSAAEMTTELIQYMCENSTLSCAEAEALLSGIMLDTKNFVLRAGVRTFEAAAYLRKCGADSVNAKGLLANSLETYKNKYTLIASAEIYKSCAVTHADKDMKDARITASQAADELLYIEGVDASFAIYVTGDTVNISARSLGKINVQLIMEAFGGGGHHTMAAAQIKNSSVDEVINALHKEIDSLSVE